MTCSQQIAMHRSQRGGEQPCQDGQPHRGQQAAATAAKGPCQRYPISGTMPWNKRVFGWEEAHKHDRTAEAVIIDGKMKQGLLIYICHRV